MSDSDSDSGPVTVKLVTAGFDARFPNTNQTKHCWQNYIDYHKCIQARGDDFPACKQFWRAYHSLCPNEWMMEQMGLRAPELYARDSPERNLVWGRVLGGNGHEFPLRALAHIDTPQYAHQSPSHYSHKRSPTPPPPFLPHFRSASGTPSARRASTRPTSTCRPSLPLLTLNPPRSILHIPKSDVYPSRACCRATTSEETINSAARLVSLTL
ncbi:hypothetical protein BC936DRAFT_139880 [Jimgerdemannia flammicorona]|uniref:Cytochrome c oxidase subunit 12, mitochondrial n=1 Tax=Jimgerdemannia flammicorona TaxID=994334 RepID=A0A433DHG8_9FUNG|nr:hypothetical protein BC936DRAFT_139880 [Jimgerdemannia flammicorona]